MKSGFALLLLVVVAGLVECKPSPDLQARVQARVDELIAKRGKGKYISLCFRKKRERVEPLLKVFM